MSNLSGNSTGSSSALPGRNFFGVPRRCWCGEAVMLKLSRSKDNPQMRYFRCAQAAAAMLSGDNHLFKWMDEAVLNELDILDAKIGSLTQELMGSRLETERMQREMESTIFERVDLVLVEAKTWFKKIVGVLVILFMISCISLKFIR